MGRKFGLIEQIKCEKETEIHTREHRKIINEDLPIMIDLLFKITYYVETIDTNTVNFKSYCYDHYMQVPYTFSCLYNIYVSGYYNEVMILIRNRYEVLAKLKYFYKHENKLEGFLKGEWMPESKFLKFDSDGNFLKNDYNFLSQLAHGKTAFTVFRTEKPYHKEYIEGNHFDEEFVDFILMQIIALLYGYINCFVLFFPNNEMNKDIEFYNLYNETIENIERIIKWHKQNNPQSEELYSSIETYICR